MRGWRLPALRHFSSSMRGVPMSTLQKLLEAHVEKVAEKYGADKSDTVLHWVDAPRKAHAFKAGAQSLAPLLLAAVEGLRLLEEFAQHDFRCALHDRKLGALPHRPCDCGLEKAFEEIAKLESLSLIAASLKREGA